MPHRRGLPIILLASLALLTACLPNRVVIDLDPGDGTLEETAVLADPGVAANSPKIAIIHVTGLLSHLPSPGLIASSSNPVDALFTRLDKAAQDPQTRAVILWVNSPGGTVGASDTMYTELRHFRESTDKPIVVCMGEIATSGAYYISLAADHVIAQPSSVTGSIGVLIQTFNFSEGMRRVGVSGRAVTSGENKSLTNPFEPPVEEHYVILQNMVNGFYDQFKGLVAERRPVAAAAPDFDALTDGRVFTGVEAARVNLVDQTGSLRDAFAAAKDLAGIDRARLVKYHAKGVQPRSPYNTASRLSPRLGGDTTVNVLSLELGPDAISPGFYYLWQPTAP